MTKTPENLITQHLDTWTQAIETKSSAGRGSSNKFTLVGIKKLRELILEMAVRGLLVPQDPSDEPARELLEKIAAEKAQLIKDGKIKKTKALPEISEDEKSYDLPEGWEWTYLPQVTAFDKYAIKRGPFGSSLKKAFFVPSGFKVYEQQHAINDNFSIGEYYVNEEKFEELKAFEVKPNDIIISCSGTVGRVAVAPLSMERGLINQALLKITLNENGLLNNYFKVLFPAYYMETNTLNDLKGTAQKNMVSVDTLKKEPFPLPPIEEQKRIVAKVDELMALCDQLEQQTLNSIEAHQTLVETLLNELVNPNNTTNIDQAWSMISENFDVLFTTEKSIHTLKQTILQLAVMGKLVPQNPDDEPASELLKKIATEKAQLIKDKKIKKTKPLPEITDKEKPFDLPNGWKWVRLTQLSADIHYGYTASANHNLSDIRLLRITDIQDDKVDWETVPGCEIEFKQIESYLLENDDILIARTGGTVGKSYLVKNISVSSVFASYLIRVRKLDNSYSDFLKVFLGSELYWTQLNDSTSGTGQPNVNGNALKALKVALPPKEEQKRIVVKVNELMALCDQLKTQLQIAQKTQINLSKSIVDSSLNRMN